MESKGINEKAILVQMKTEFISQSKKATKPTQEIEEKHKVQNAGAFFKSLFDRKVFKDINTARNMAYNAHQRMSLPWMDSNIRILPISLFEKYTAAVNKHIEAADNAVKVFAENYDEIIESNKDRLSDLFNINDYPSRASLLSEFKVYVNYFPVPTSDTFSALATNSEAMSSLKSKYNAEMTEFENNAKSEIAVRLDVALRNVVTRLEAQDKKVQDRLLTKIIGVISELKALNFSGDNTLGNLLKDVEMSLSKENGTTLSENNTLRKKKANETRDLIGKIEESFPEVKLRRALSF